MFELVFTESAIGDLRYLSKADQNLILDTVEQQLLQEPLTVTRNRKPLHPNDISTWELRIGQHRVFYDVDTEDNVITVKAVGWKEDNKLFIRGKEFEL
jgi:mRNA-degrading endonuclease RelE of RelBE toxin-antitoxin system